MIEKREQPEREAEEQADAKSHSEQQLEEEWSQGGQDVEEEQHDEPSVDA